MDGIKIRDGITGADLHAIVTEARRAGRPVYGHTYGLRQGRYHDYTRAAVEAGVNGIFHVGGMAPVDPSLEPAMPKDATWQQQWLHGSTRWLAVTEASADALIASMIRHGVWLQPTLVTEELTGRPDWYADSPDWKYSPLPKFAGEASGWPVFAGADLARYRQSYSRMKWFVRRLHDAGGLIVAGTDGVPIPGFGLQDELQLLVDAGLSPLAAIRTATVNAARAFSLGDTVGRLEAGARADIVLLDGNPLEDIGNTRKLHGVMRAGEYFDRRALDEFLRKADQARQ